MRMPVVDGFKATRRIRETNDGKNVVILALTASVLDEERDHILAEGCNDFLRKPFRELDLYDAMAKHLGIRFIYKEDLPEAKIVNPIEDRRQFDNQDVDTSTAKDIFYKDLWQATIEADLEAINDAIDSIRSENPHLAGVLTELADNFEHDAMLDMLHQMITGASE
jgi:hypothetical protein